MVNNFAKPNDTMSGFIEVFFFVVGIMESERTENEIQLLVTKILYKRYTETFHWLIFHDLYRLIDIMEQRYKTIEKFGRQNLHTIDVTIIEKTHDRVFPLLESIDRAKIERLSSSRNNKLETTNAVNASEQMFSPSKVFNSEEKKNDKHIFSKVDYIFIDSRDRNLEKWPLVNPFQTVMGVGTINLDNGKQENTIQKVFSQVEQIIFNKIIIPLNDSQGENIIEKYPYILFSVPELGTQTNGTNKYLTNSITQLVNPTIRGNFASFIFDTTKENFDLSYIFNPRIELSKLTFHFLTPSGDLIEFSTDPDSQTHQNHQIAIGMYIKSIQKTMVNNFINRPT